jgi:LAO/AO transport system kinase
MIELVQPLLNGDRRALARVLTGVENQQAGDVLAAVYPHTGRAHIIGVTGAPGTGKSTLVAALAGGYRAQHKTVGILAVDPTSPFSGGAVLGDRIRMQSLAGDKGVFIRSMASRGSLGGLASAALDAIRVLDAAGMDVVIVETVGAGQSEVDIARAAHTTLVVEAPGLGDEIQAIKAGLLEIADVLVVNKADRPGAENAVRALRMMLDIGHPVERHHGRFIAASPVSVAEPPPMWIPPVIATVASKGEGIDELLVAISDHHRFLVDHHMLGRLEQEQIEVEICERLRNVLVDRLLESLPQGALMEVVRQVQARQVTPQRAVEVLLGQGHI